MPDIASNILLLKKKLPPAVKLVAISKTKSTTEILDAYNTGHRIFGENRVQELLSKKDLLPRDIEWHLVGHLQSNKVKYIVPFISMIHSVDSFRVLQAINSEAQKINRVVDCLLQFHIAMEETKSGFSMAEVNEMVLLPAFNDLQNIRICGVMGMATFTDDTSQVRKEFRYLKDCFKTMKEGIFLNNKTFNEISMGMSGDYTIAIAEGSTMVRLGNIIFGARK